MTHSSSSFATGRRLRAALALTGASLALVALAACAPEDGAKPSSSPSATGAPSSSSSATASAEPNTSATPTTVPPEGTAVALACTDILSADDVYALNPNTGPDPDYSPTSDTAITATTYSGVSCGWSNQSSGDVTEVSVAKPNETLTNTLKDTALADGTIVPTYGAPPAVEGYFSKSTSTAQVFTNGYWVAVSSPGMTEPGDAERIMSTVLGNL